MIGDEIITTQRDMDLYEIRRLQLEIDRLTKERDFYLTLLNQCTQNTMLVLAERFHPPFDPTGAPHYQ